MDAPFIERQKRVSERDNLFRKGSMVLRDLVVRQSLKKGIRYKKIDMIITNTGDLECLQQMANNIYNRVIKEPSINNVSLQEKYGGYKITSIKEVPNNKKENGLDISQSEER